MSRKERGLLHIFPRLGKAHGRAGIRTGVAPGAPHPWPTPYNVEWSFSSRAFSPPMSVDVLTFGLNHVSAPVSVRERVSLPLELVRPALAGLRSAFGGAVREAAILSTC